MSAGRTLTGAFGTAVEHLFESDAPDHQAHIGTWLLHCPGQSPAWSHYMLAAVHLRPLPGESRPAHRRWPHATHEFVVAAIDPACNPTVDDELGSWALLRPINVCQQVELPDDAGAAEILRLCAQAVVDGLLPAEPPLAGDQEPWRTCLLQTAAHQRGEAHGPALRGRR